MSNPAIQFRNIARGIKKNGINIKNGHFICNGFDGEKACICGAIAINVLGRREAKNLDNRSTEIFGYVPELAKVLNVPVNVVQSLEYGFEGKSYYDEVPFKPIKRYVKIGKKVAELVK